MNQQEIHDAATKNFIKMMFEKNGKLPTNQHIRNIDKILGFAIEEIKRKHNEPKT